MAKVYVASSWRNLYYPDVVAVLQGHGHAVWDWRSPQHSGADQMTRTLATHITGAVFDHIERERNLVRSCLEETINDALLLSAAKQGSAAVEPDPVRAATENMIRLVMSKPSLAFNTPSELDAAIAKVYHALVSSGWRT